MRSYFELYEVSDFSTHLSSLFFAFLPTYSMCITAFIISHFYPISLHSCFCCYLLVLSSPSIPSYPFLRALALSVAMMVYGKEEGADSLIEQLSKDRGVIDVIIWVEGYHDYEHKRKHCIT